MMRRLLFDGIVCYDDNLIHKLIYEILFHGLRRTETRIDGNTCRGFVLLHHQALPHTIICMKTFIACHYVCIVIIPKIPVVLHNRQQEYARRIAQLEWGNTVTYLGEFLKLYFAVKYF